MTIAPPAQGAWYDVDDVTTKVLARLRLVVSDVDRTRIAQLVDVAAGLINNELDRGNPMTPVVDQDQPDTMVTPDILEALERVTVELYARGRVSAPGGVLVTGMSTGEAIDIVRAELGPHKSRWGLA